MSELPLLIRENLCVYDPQSDVYSDLGGGERPDDCACDRCFYGRDKLAIELIARDQRIAELQAEIRNMNASLEDACREIEARRNHAQEAAADTDRLMESANSRVAELEADNERLRAAILEGLTRLAPLLPLDQFFKAQEDDDKPLPVGPHDRSWCG